MMFSVEKLRLLRWVGGSVAEIRVGSGLRQARPAAAEFARDLGQGLVTADVAREHDVRDALGGAVPPLPEGKDAPRHPAPGERGPDFQAARSNVGGRGGALCDCETRG